MSAPLPSLRRVNVLYAAVQIFYWAAFAVFAGYQTALLLGRGFSGADAGVFAAIRCLAGILAQPLLGGWADRHPAVPLKRLLNVCLAASLAVNLFFYVSRPGFWGTAAVFLLLGILELNAYPLLDSLAVQFINAGLDVDYSLGRGLASFAFAVSCVVLGRQAAALGVETVLLTHVALLVLLMAAVAVFPVAPRSASGAAAVDAPHSVGQILRESPAFTVMLAAVFLAMTAVMPIVNFLMQIVYDRGGGEGDLGVALFLMGAVELPAALVFPALWRKLGSRKTLVVSVVFMACKPLVFLAARSLPLLLLAQVIQMPGYGLFTPASVYYTNENVSPADRVRGQAIMMVASNGLGGMMGNLLSGYVLDMGGADAMMAVNAAIGAAGVVLALIACRMEKRA